MTAHRPPRLPLALLQRVVPDSSPLAGDLVEEFEQGRSSGWLWWQVLVAIALARLERSDEIRPLHLVDLQPADAAERSRRTSLRFRPINLTGSPVPGVGGLTLVVLSILLTVVVPGVWWVYLASIAAGIILGVAMIARRDASWCKGAEVQRCKGAV